MHIQVNTDNHIEGSEKLTRQVEGVVEGAVGRFSDRITRVEIHLTDQSGSAKARGNDMRCVIEARPASHRPIAVSHEGTSLEQALDGAASKLEKSLSRTFERLDDTMGRTPHRWGPNGLNATFNELPRVKKPKGCFHESSHRR